MLSAIDVDNDYAAALKDRVSLSGVRSGSAVVADNVRARIAGYSPAEIGGAALQGDQRVIVLKSDLDREGFPLPVKGDSIAIGARAATVWTVDPNTKKIGETIIAYVLVVRGA